ncbi:VWA domain-containing protein [Mariniblastus sp.]|nr:VWA domain-containing protein [Mariniblastus sp.]MDB4374629.1 VWA domain-containing protein [bacterium]MDB4555451.1 VWA domain-containing protein [bacterium]MDC3223441.1 VWA domain-containing protein [Mariniblastus sp.]
MVDINFIPEFAAAGVFLLSAGAEAIHMVRIRRLSSLAFGPKSSPAFWVKAAAPLKIIAYSLICWGLVSLLFVKPKTHNSTEIDAAKQRHVILLLDVSPSMRLVDAGPTGTISRTQRGAEIVESLFDRVPIRQYKLSVIAFYNEAMPVVIDTDDLEVVKNTLSDLPMHFAFQGKDTNLFKGLQQAAEIAAPWNPESAILMVVTDGDTVPSTGMPPMPKSISNVLLVGVGDPITGKFIAGKNSRQDTSTLRQVATRLNGEFHNGNVQHISSSMISNLTQKTQQSRWQDLTRREYALLAITLGTLVLCVLPFLLHYFGTRWKPGIA